MAANRSFRPALLILAPQLEIGTEKGSEIGVGGTVLLREPAPQGRRQRLAPAGFRGIDPPQGERRLGEFGYPEKPMEIRGDAVRPRDHILMPQYQHLSAREAGEKSGKVLGVKPP
jgi:hypothetical protein